MIGRIYAFQSRVFERKREEMDKDEVVQEVRNDIGKISFNAVS